VLFVFGVSVFVSFFGSSTSGLVMLLLQLHRHITIIPNADKIFFIIILYLYIYSLLTFGFSGYSVVFQEDTHIKKHGTFSILFKGVWRDPTEEHLKARAYTRAF
jgi:hypothetical protein